MLSKHPATRFVFSDHPAEMKCPSGIPQHVFDVTTAYIFARVFDLKQIGLDNRVHVTCLRNVFNHMQAPFTEEPFCIIHPNGVSIGTVFFVIEIELFSN